MRSSTPPTAVRVGGLALAGVVLVAAGLVYLGGGDASSGARIELASARRGTIVSGASAAGNTVDANTRDLAFGASGTVEKVYVSVGQKVAKGQVLARIDDTLAREDYTAAKASLAAAEETRDKLEEAQNAPSGASGGSGGSGTSGSGAPSAVPSGGGTPSAVPTGRSTARPSAGPSAQPSARPSTPAPTGSPSGRPSASPSTQPSCPPSSAAPAPTGRPDTSPTSEPSAVPSIGVTITPNAARLAAAEIPVADPADRTVAEAGDGPAPADPSPAPSSAPAPSPSATPSPTPTPTPTPSPTATSTSTPKPAATERAEGGTGSRRPTPSKTAHKPAPTRTKRTLKETARHAAPTATPTKATPVASPSHTYTARPTVKPTARPTAQPTVKPTAQPTVKPTPRPSGTVVIVVPPAGGPTAAPEASGTPTARPSATCGANGGQTGKPSPSPQGGKGQGGQSGQNGRGQAGQGAQGGQGGTRAGQGGQVTTVAQAEANVSKATTALRNAEDALAGVTIKAPAKGTILTVSGTVGTQAVAGSAFITLGNLDELQVKAMFSQTDVGRLKVGQPASVSLATRTGETYDGKVAHIDVTATTTNKLVQYGVMIAFDRRPKGLLLGQTATVQVTLDEAENAVYVPAQAVRTRADGVATVLVRNGGQSVERTVELGVRGDQYVEIRSGLSEGDQLELPGSTTSGDFPDDAFPGLAATPAT
ncbi:efflux RND transporter periplasmic adaptor subunit [Sphaerisporangium perillae]|uniref:efflux RND transporter periplasmic adaptor subunit n=1 Tax=Sphaerisporangium perillae TaxID=2935860 RepID=UPI00200D8F30|nr:efflux RND transporter periplasmic adaptor subunit [Sphaerisporangium perillae]